jgi:putative membrane protein
LKLELGWPPVVVGLIVIMLAILFFLFSFIPGLMVRWRLGAAVRQVRRLSRDDGPVLRDRASQPFRRSRILRHLWDQYAETLHDQYEDRDGERVVAKVRSTVPAEVFFTPQAVVDTPTQAEFFKHLPGILTGIGIIGTFIGLILGLHDFNVSSQPEALNAELKKLFTSVTEAFIASGLAISAAMVVTLLEKLLLNWNYAALERLVHAIDALYDAGAGEEYLARLVRSSEESATQTRHLKDSLVEDLKLLLTELTERQIQAARVTGDRMGGHIGATITQSLEAPLNRIAGIVERASGEQGTAVHGMLENLMSAFMAKLDDTLGEQMKGLNGMMADSARSMRETQAGFERLIQEMRDAGDTAGRSMQEQLARMMGEAEER